MNHILTTYEPCINNRFQHIYIYIYISPYITIYYHISPTQTRVNGHHMKPSHGGIADGWERRGTGADREADVHGIPWHYVFNMFKYV